MGTLYVHLRFFVVQRQLQSTNIRVLQAGEDLDEDEDFEDLDEEAHAGVVPASVLRQRQLAREENAGTGERAPLLRNATRGISVTRLKRGKSVGKTGDATVTQAVLMVSVKWIGWRCWALITDHWVI
jgi:hypothetical protein